MRGVPAATKVVAALRRTSDKTGYCIVVASYGGDDGGMVCAQVGQRLQRQRWWWFGVGNARVPPWWQAVALRMIASLIGAEGVDGCSRAEGWAALGLL